METERATDPNFTYRICLRTESVSGQLVVEVRTLVRQSDDGLIHVHILSRQATSLSLSPGSSRSACCCLTFFFPPSCFWLSDVTVSFQMGSAWRACQSPARYAKSSSPGPRPSLSTASPARRSTATLRWMNMSSPNRTQSGINSHAVGSFCLWFLFIYLLFCSMV